MRRTLLLLAMAAMALMVAMPMAFAAIRTGTDGPETLTGTNDNDKITGKGGDDITNGKKGNDAYNYADGWGVDAVSDSGGVDALNFSGVTQRLEALLCPEVTLSGENLGVSADTQGNRVTYSSRIEKATGGSSGDTVFGCTGKNVLSGGGNDGTSLDQIADLGGYTQQGVNLPPSSDVYGGFKPGSATMVLDTGGKDDLLNLGAFGSRGVDLYRFDANRDGSANSLVILFDGTFEPGDIHGVVVINQFGQDWSVYFNGKVENIKFKDKTISPKPGSLNTLPAPSGVAVEALLPEARDAGGGDSLLGLTQ